MADLLDTNLNQNPYFSDYDPDKQYYHTLFKPAVGVQARELNVLQEALYHQIYRMGQNLFVSGTIISGCNISTNPKLPYVKILDSFANGVPITSTSTFVNNYLISSSGLKALVTQATDGLVSLSPNLNTLYVAYLNTVQNATTNAVIKVFQNDEVLSVVTAGNSLIGQITVANTISSGSSNTTGVGYLLSVDNGVIFQKGMMLDVVAQSILVSPYSSTPNDISIGFSSVESIVTSYQDQTLLDNAQGSPNLNAPGADRLKITPTLIAVNTSTINSSVNNFFSIVNFINGAPSVQNQNTVYSVIGDNMANRLYETNGDFIVRPFNIRTLAYTNANGSIADPNSIRVEIDKGEAYVKGYRVAIDGQIPYVIQKGTDYYQVNNAVISTAIGDYLQITEVSGLFDAANYQAVNFLDAPVHSVSNGLNLGISPNVLSVTANVIGSGVIYTTLYNTGTVGSANAIYDCYILNLNMNNGKSFNQVKALQINNGGTYAYADTVLKNGLNVLNDTDFATKILNTNQTAIKTYKTSNNTIDTQFFTKVKSNITIPTSGNVNITIPSFTGANSSLAYGSGPIDTPTLTSGFSLVCETNVHTANISGSVTISSGNNTVTGVGTTLTAVPYLTVGSYISIVNATSSETRQVASIVNNTTLTTTNPFTNSWTSANVYVTYLPGQIISLAGSNSSINVVNSTVMTLTLPTTINTSMNAYLFYNVLLQNVAPAKKYLQKTLYAKIDCSNNVGGTTGPWCLGLPDVVSISNVWVGTTYSNTNPSYTGRFNLFNGQRDGFYQQGYLYNKGVSLSSSSKILVELQAYVADYSSGYHYFNIDSYPVDDTGVTPNSIFTQDIPYYTDTNKNVYSLRNCLDFRPYCGNTIPYVSNLALAISNTQIINPNVNLVLSNSIGSGIVPDTLLESSYQYYVGRYDKIGLKQDGTVAYTKGNPSLNPLPPIDIPNGITLAMFKIPPYPSLTPDVANTIFNPYQSVVTTTYKPNKRYTMADIGTLDNRLQQVEYYTSLSVLEQSAQNLQLLNQAGQTRFKNGILVDPMNDFAIANTIDPEFNIAIDSVNSAARPVFTQFNLDLKPTAYNGTQISDNRLITLSFTQYANAVVSQPFASHLRNASQYRLWVWDGTLKLNPPGDYQPDVTENPLVNITLDQYSNWTNLANAWGTQWGTWNEISSVNTVTTVTNSTSTTTSVATTVTSEQVGKQIAINPETSTYSFGDVVTGVSIQPYVKSQIVQFEAHGLKPNTPMYLFINDHQIIYRNDSNITTDAPMWTNNYNIVNTGNFITDSTGSMYGQFKIPPKTFYTGILNVQFVDMQDLHADADVITTQATTKFFAQNLSYTQNKLDLTTIEPVFSYNTITNIISNTTVSNTTIYNPPTYNPYQPYYPYNNPDGGGSVSADPIAQSFEITSSQLTPSIEGVYINSVDLFFESRAGDIGLDANNGAITNNQVWDDSLGITVQIQPLSNGTIQEVIVPFSRVHVNPINVRRSAGSRIPCNIQFDAPVFLSVDTSYAVVVIPDGGNPYYNMWTGVIGDFDLITKAPIYNFTTVGDMFLSSQGDIWTAYGNENLKLNVYPIYFTQTSGYTTINNEDYEYLSLNSLVNGFLQSENIYFQYYMLTTNGGNVSNTSNIVTMPDTTHVNNNWPIGIISVNNQEAFVANVTSVINSTAITINSNSLFTDNAAIVMMMTPFNKTPTVKYANTTDLVVLNPTANSTYYITSNVQFYMIGATSHSYATGYLVDKPYNTLCPKFSQSLPSECTITYSMQGYSNNYVRDTSYTPLNYNLETTFLDIERVVYSRSNEIIHLNGNKSLTINVAFTTLTPAISPAIDTAKMGAVVVHNIINDDDANNDIFYSEMTNTGNAINKYISTTVTLAPGLDAEDLIVYLGAYYPPGSKIYVYAKLKNEYDNDLFDSKKWSPMISNNTYRSSTTNLNDIAEYIYTFPTTPFSNSTAYVDTSNNNVVSYQNGNGTVFGTYNQYAIKIVLLSNSSVVVPQIDDYRCLALSR